MGYVVCFTLSNLAIYALYCSLPGLSEQEEALGIKLKMPRTLADTQRTAEVCRRVRARCSCSIMSVAALGSMLDRLVFSLFARRGTCPVFSACWWAVVALLQVLMQDDHVTHQRHPPSWTPLLTPWSSFPTPPPAISSFSRLILFLAPFPLAALDSVQRQALPAAGAVLLQRVPLEAGFQHPWLRGHGE